MFSCNCTAHLERSTTVAKNTKKPIAKKFTNHKVIIALALATSPKVQRGAAVEALAGAACCKPVATGALAGTAFCEPFKLTKASAKIPTKIQSIFITAPSPMLATKDRAARLKYG
jgi:hypothetical protein